MTRYRIRKHTRAGEIWFTIQARFLFFFWRTNCDEDDSPVRYGTLAEAADVVAYRQQPTVSQTILEF